MATEAKKKVVPRVVKLDKALKLVSALRLHLTFLGLIAKNHIFTLMLLTSIFVPLFLI